MKSIKKAKRLHIYVNGVLTHFAKKTPTMPIINKSQKRLKNI